MLEVINLTKKYGEKCVVDNISFTISKGEIVGFLGPNGAGKSTTMNMMTGYIASSEGEVKIDGISILENPIEYKKKIGYLPEIPPLYPDMTVYEYLSFVSEIKKVSKDKIDDILKEVKIEHVKHRLIKNLSKGYRQRVGIAQALVGDSELLILDEPTVGLDPMQIIEIRNVIEGLKGKKTIFISSHILSEMSAVCDKVLIINQGKLIAIDTPQNLNEMVSGKNKYIITAIGEKENIESVLSQIDAIDEFSFKEEKGEEITYILKAKEGKDVRKDISKALSDKDILIVSFKAFDMTLEDIFITLTTKEEKKWNPF